MFFSTPESGQPMKNGPFRRPIFRIGPQDSQRSHSDPKSGPQRDPFRFLEEASRVRAGRPPCIFRLSKRGSGCVWIGVLVLLVVGVLRAVCFACSLVLLLTVWYVALRGGAQCFFSSLFSAVVCWFVLYLMVFEAVVVVALAVFDRHVR